MTHSSLYENYASTFIFFVVICVSILVFVPTNFDLTDVSVLCGWIDGGCQPRYDKCVCTYSTSGAHPLISEINDTFIM